jgi:hypothetical protein
LPSPSARAIRYQYWLQQSEKHFTGLQPNIPKDRQPLLYVLINLPQRVLNDPAASELSSRLSRYSNRPATAEMLQIGNAKSDCLQTMCVKSASFAAAPQTLCMTALLILCRCLDWNSLECWKYIQRFVK